MKKIILFVLVLFFHFSGFSNNSTSNTGDKKIKYVFYFIGDGMGLAQVHATELYLASKAGSPEPGFLNMNKLPHRSFITTHATNRYITGSAAAASAMSSGQKTSINTIGLNENHDEPLIPVSEKIKDRGMKIGIISTVSLDHATPAGFYAHREKRNMYYEIGLDLVNSDFDFFAGGGFAFPEGRYRDKKNLVELARENDYHYVNSKDAFLALKPSDGKVLAINENIDLSAAMPYAIDQQSNDLSLKEILGKAVEMLNNENGFFIMLEGGKIDWSCHMNDAATTIKEVIAFDESIAVALDFYEKHPDETVIIVTADHETGGLSVGSAYKKYQINYSLIDQQKASMEIITERYMKLENPAFKQALTFVEENFGFNGGEPGLKLNDYDLERLKTAFKNLNKTEEIPNHPEMYEAYGSYHPFIATAVRIFNQKLGIDFTTWAHTGIPVPLFYIGLDPETFTGLTDNTDVPLQIEKVLDIVD